MRRRREFDVSKIRNKDTTTVKEAMNQLLDSYKLRRKFTETQLINSWSKLMGESIAKRTKNIYFKDEKLFVELTSAPLKQELSMSKGKILELFMGEFNELLVKDVIFL